ncbi:histidyl-tRNA synthetase [Halarchaeum acidiphilum MH1-52-1]|uniref:Histidine--tRNA ligase n=1 Tax=Halarchaeum acidiphilum MH1-52-1 TaxID=1261545 RepID=U2YYC4_9EURY|nr:histidyl-tRNA synthetase [Halarchaeum acidiphilum MH1-52-1]
MLNSVDADVRTRDAIRVVDKREKLDYDDYIDRLAGTGLSVAEAEEFDDVIASNDLDDLVAFADTERVEAAVENLRAVLDAAADFGAREHVDVSLATARGLDYYTGVVFECFDSTGEVGRSVFGGGRYDDLIESFGGQPTPAVGFATGYSTLPQLLQRAGVWPEEAVRTDYYVLSVGEVRDVASRVARDLRERGHVVESDVSGRSFGSQMNYADSINAETVVIVGERDLAEGNVTVKDMVSGDQVQVPVEDFPGEHDEPRHGDFA